VVSDIVDRQFAFSLGGSTAAQGDQTAQPPIRRAVGSQQNGGRRVDGCDLGANEQLETAVFGRRVCSNDTSQTVAIRNGKRRISQFGGLRNQLIRMRCAFEERKIRFAVQFGIAQTGPRWFSF
jgi:hypothetical protein